MQSGKNTIELTPAHRVVMLTLVIIQYIAFGWALLLMVNYHAFRLPFLDYPSLITA
jgi:hypothetical protein